MEIKQLAQARLTSVPQVLYTCPGDKSTLIKTIHVAGARADADPFQSVSIYIVPAGGVANYATCLHSRLVIAADGFFRDSDLNVMPPGSTLVAVGVGHTVTVSGVEQGTPGAVVAPAPGPALDNSPDVVAAVANPPQLAGGGTAAGAPAVVTRAMISVDGRAPGVAVYASFDPGTSAAGVVAEMEHRFDADATWHASASAAASAGQMNIRFAPTPKVPPTVPEVHMDPSVVVLHVRMRTRDTASGLASPWVEVSRVVADPADLFAYLSVVDPTGPLFGLNVVCSDYPALAQFQYRFGADGAWSETLACYADGVFFGLQGQNQGADVLMPAAAPAGTLVFVQYRLVRGDSFTPWMPANGAVTWPAP